MSFHRRLCVTATALVFLLSPVAVASAQQPQQGTGSVRGQVADGSDAVVPGVTVDVVVAGRVVATVVTDEQGRFELAAVPPGSVALRMALDGFETATVSVFVLPDVVHIVSGVLHVAALSETVVVRAPAPVPPPPYPPLPPPPPQYEPRYVPRLDLELVCGPAKPRRSDVLAGRLGEHRQESQRILYRLGDELTIDPESAATFTVGQNFVARRYFRAGSAMGGGERGEHTAGVVQVSSVAPNAVTAVVIHSCGELLEGDLLMPFVPEPMPVAEPSGTPKFRDAARIIFGEADQLMGAQGRMMVIDRGQRHGMRPGQRLTIFRRSFGGRAVVGEAIVLAVREDSARIRVERAGGAIWFGDSVAPQEPAGRLSSRRD